MAQNCVLLLHFQTTVQSKQSLNGPNSPNLVTLLKSLSGIFCATLNRGQGDQMSL
jgi:hypothetical protein